MQELFEDVWGDKKEIVFDHALDLPFKVMILCWIRQTDWTLSTQITLFVIGAAGFGKKISWKDTSLPPAGHKMNFQVLMLFIYLHSAPIPDVSVYYRTL